MRLFASPKLNSLLLRLRPPEGEVISSPLLTRSIEVAQKRVEQRNFSYRKHTLEYDDVMNKHRQEIYAFRNELLHSENVSEVCEDILKDVIVHKSSLYFTDPTREETWDAEGYRQWLMSFFPVRFPEGAFAGEHQPIEHIYEKALEVVIKAFRIKLAQETQKVLLIERKRDQDDDIVLRAQKAVNGTLIRILVHQLDRLWQEHLLTMDNLRTEVSLRSVGQKDPLMEFKQEAFISFSHLNEQLYTDMSKDLFSFIVVPHDPGLLQEMRKQLKLETKQFMRAEDKNEKSETQPEDGKVTPCVVEDRTGRNDPCPCGSGKKFKKCCGLAEIHAE